VIGRCISQAARAGGRRFPYGRLSPAKQRQLKDLEKTVYVFEPDLAQPPTLGLDEGQDILCFVGPIIVGLCDFLSGNAGIGSAMVIVQVIESTR
jgi:hypothetical protein